MNVSPMVSILTKRRTELGISQRKLDEIMGVSSCMTAKWETGRRSPTASSLERWARALGLSLQLVLPTEGKRKRKH